MENTRLASIFLVMAAGMTGFIVILYGDNVLPKMPSTRNRKLQEMAPKPTANPRVYHVTSYGADPTGKTDSTDAILAAVSDALNGPGKGVLMTGITNLGGARVDLDGGNYVISRPVRFNVAGRGNLVIHGGSITASTDFPNDGYLIDLSPTNSSTEYNYEFVTLRDLFLDSDFHGGGIRIVKSLRTNIDNCYIAHFNTTGISVHGGHETYIRHTYLGQHITAGGDSGERYFSGTGIVLTGNDNSITDVVIFSAATGVMITGQANTISGLHCYNKANGFGGVGIYLKTPGLTQTRIVNSYLDFTGIVAEDPVQLTISGSFFLGDAFVLLKSIKGVAKGVTIVDNMFSGSGKGVAIVQLDRRNGDFNQVEEVVIDKNNAEGMKMKATVARGSAVQATGDGGAMMTWTADFSSVLVFPNIIRQVQYTFVSNGSSYPAHAVRSVADNRVVIQSDVAEKARVYVTADQGGAS